MYRTDKEENEFSRDDLIEIMDNFTAISCDNCGDSDNWTCLKIYLNDKDDVYDQFKINIFKEDGKIWGKPEDGEYSPAQIDMAISLIREKIEQEKDRYHPAKSKGSVFIMVDFIGGKRPDSKVSVFDVDGVSIEMVSKFIDAIAGSPGPKGISSQLKSKLEAAFEDLKKDMQNPLVITHLKSQDGEVNIYLIAKDPNKEVYYGILETEFTAKRQIAGIPLANIRAMDVDEVPLKPFRAKRYIESGLKE